MKYRPARGLVACAAIVVGACSAPMAQRVDIAVSDAQARCDSLHEAVSWHDGSGASLLRVAERPVSDAAHDSREVRHAREPPSRPGLWERCGAAVSASRHACLHHWLVACG